MDHAVATKANQNLASEHYDAPTLFFHWLTALLVLALLGTSLVWNYWTPRDRFWRPLMENTHVSLGILFGVLILARIVWRLTGARRVQGEAGWSGVLSKIMYAALYILLAADVALGFGLRWVQGEEFSFFNLFDVPALFARNRALVPWFENSHNWVSWAIVILAAGHALAALYHHYVLKDRVMRRMISVR